MKRTTGTHVYTLLKCDKAVALDLVGDPDRRRPLRPEEEFVLARGRDLEARIVAELGWPEPEFPARDWEAGAKATEAMLRDGVEGVSQGILLGDGRLGIPDLLRREAGGSGLGDFHYVVGDVKSSARPRGDQILQVVFYSELLAALQDRAPEYGYLVLRDGSEQRFAIDDYTPALHQVMSEIETLRAAPSALRPFWSSACGRCAWSTHCETELAATDDLSFLPGMTRALRASLERAGFGSCAALDSADVHEVADAARLELVMVERLKRSARARRTARPLFEPGGANRRVSGAFVHLLFDPFAERLLWIGVVDAAGNVRDYVPTSRTSELGGWSALVAQLPPDSRLLHYGTTLPRWFEHRSHEDPNSLSVEARFVDLGRRLRAAAVLPTPVFGLEDHVGAVLEVDPHRAGRADEAALRAEQGDVEWLRNKGRSDLGDLRALAQALLESAELAT